MKRSAGIVWFSVSVLAVAGFTAQGWAQSRINTDKFIEGLQERGMSELLLHFAETQDLEPAEKMGIQVQQHRIRADNVRLPEAERVKSCEEAMKILHQLIDDKKHADHPKRPMWQTDLAQVAILTYLRVLKHAATEFYEFGVPNQSQSEAMGKTISDVLLNLADAQRGYTNLQGELPNRPDYKEKYEFTGLAERIDEYREKRNPYFFAYAAYYTSMLPDSAHYYQNLGKERRMPRQRTDPAQERQRLRKAALDAMSTFVEDPGAPEAMKLRAKCLIGRIHLLMGNAAGALGNLDPVARAGKGDYNEFLAQLGQAMAYGKKGELDRAMQLTDALSRHTIAESSPLYKILLTDLKHRILKDRAGEDARKVARSYAPYERLLQEQPDLGPSWIFPRWEAMIADDAELKNLPGMMLLGVGQQAMQQGGVLVEQATKALEANKEAESEKLMKQAGPKLDKAIRLLGELGGREAQETKSVRAKALWFLGVCQYFKAGPEGGKTLPALLTALDTWIKMASALPEEKESQLAIQNSVGLLRQYLASTDGAIQKQIMPTYLNAVKVLLANFEDNPVTDDQRSFYADYLIEQGENLEAIKVLRKVPQGHSTFYDAKRILIEAQYGIYKQEKSEGKKPNPGTILNDIRILRSDAEDAMQSLEGDEALPPTLAAATSRIIESQLAVDIQDPKKALKALENFEKLFAKYPDLIEQALEQRIKSLATLGRFDEADEAARKMFAEFPNSAAAVIDGVLRDINDKVDELAEKIDNTPVEQYKKDLRKEQMNLANTGERLAKQIVAWAKTNRPADEQLPYKILLYKSMTIAGKAEEASKALTKLVEANPNDANVIFALSESLYYAGRAISTNDTARKEERMALLKKAQIEFNKLIARIDPITYPDIVKEQPELLPLWWRAWLRTLLCAKLRNKGTEHIPTRVASLRQFDRNLGGSVLRRQFESLERAYKFDN